MAVVVTRAAIAGQCPSVIGPRCLGAQPGKLVIRRRSEAGSAIRAPTSRAVCADAARMRRVEILLGRFDVGALGHGRWLAIAADRPVARELEHFGLYAARGEDGLALTPVAAAMASTVVAT
jgi:hypothetical protein